MLPYRCYKPRTNPYSFHGHGRSCLSYVFELAGKYGIRVIAMEVTHESHVSEIHQVLTAGTVLEDVAIAQDAYLRRCQLSNKMHRSRP